MLNFFGTIIKTTAYIKSQPIVLAHLTRFSYLYLGNYAGVWHHKWEVFWQHKKLDKKHRGGKCFAPSYDFPETNRNQVITHFHCSSQHIWHAPLQVCTVTFPE